MVAGVHTKTTVRISRTLVREGVCRCQRSPHSQLASEVTADPLPYCGKAYTHTLTGSEKAVHHPGLLLRGGGGKDDAETSGEIGRAHV